MKLESEPSGHFIPFASARDPRSVLLSFVVDPSYSPSYVTGFIKGPCCDPIPFPFFNSTSFSSSSLLVPITTTKLPAPPHHLFITAATTSSTHYTMPGAVVGNATRIWELNVHWTLYSQCGVWDPRGRGVDIWECIRDRECCLLGGCQPFVLHSAVFADDSTPGTQPPNAAYWRYIARR